MITDGLNKAQFEAVTSEHKRILCLAGAGTGKTKTLTSRIAFLHENRVSCSSMLALTFTRLAGKEMKERVIKLIGKSEGGKLFCNTFHAFCVKVLRQYGARLGYDADFSIYDQDDCASIITTIIEDYQYKTTLKKVQEVLPCIYDIDKAINGDFATIAQEELKVIKDYQYHLKRNNAFDFDGLIDNVYRLLENNEDIRKELQNQYSHIFVDEMQDTNTLQWGIVSLINPENLFVVGDDNQSIYGWRGADISIILMLSKSPEWQTIKLEQNYRSTRPIVEAANRLIKHNVSQTEKVLISSVEGEEPVIDVLEDVQQEAKIIASATLAYVNGKYSDIAVLTRTNKQLVAIKATMDVYGIPSELVNATEDVFKKDDIRNLLAYLELLVNPKDDHAFKKAINFPEPRFTSMELAKLQLIATDNECSLCEALPEFHGTTTEFSSLMSLFEEFMDAEDSGILAMFNQLTARLDLMGLYAEQGRKFSKGEDINQAQNKLMNWAEIQKSLGEDYSVSAFLKWLHLRDIQEKLIEKQNKVKLMTVHAAKGLEFESVFIAGMNQGCFPSRRGDIEEERRLFYVAITRAKRNLYICRTQNVDAGHGGGYMSMPSQFLDEMQAP
ncbi:MAG: ATP-dependent helicase [Candidatus Paceibacterota bacterium]